MAKAKYLAWVDLETTGTDEHSDPILEIGLIVTEAERPFDVLGEYEAVVDPDPARFPAWRTSMVPFVQEMHTKNGLLADISGGRAKSIRKAEAEATMVLANIGREHQFMLAGSGVGHFDRRFLHAQMPAFEGWLQYPNLDVGVLRRAFMFAGRGDLDAFGRTFESKDDKPHRGLADVADHLNEWRAYADLFNSIPGVEV